MSKELFDKFYKRVVKESILKAALGGAAIGFAVDFLFALVTVFFAGLFHLWYVVALLVGLGVGLVSGVILYFTAFRPTTAAMARRVDELGVEQRLSTRLELEKDPSYIAMREREQNKRMGAKSLRALTTKTVALVAIIAIVLGASMTTVNAVISINASKPPAFSPEDEMPFDPNQQTNPELMVMVTYVVNDELGGWIDGETEQILYYGGSTTPVVAIPEDGYMFIGWREDENMLPERYETDVRTNLIFTAQFMLIHDPVEEG